MPPLADELWLMCPWCGGKAPEDRPFRSGYYCQHCKFSIDGYPVAGDREIVATLRRIAHILEARR
jgi:hypothetical protein